MSILINDAAIEESLLGQRRNSGLDRYDEVWDGVYVMSPAANNEHQDLATELAAILRTIIDWQDKGKTLAAANVSDRRDDWTENYRVPDVLVFLKDTSAEDCGSHWLGGPDFAVEIVSPGDRTLENLAFYARVGTRELLVIDRDPWQITLYRRLNAGMMTRVTGPDGDQGTTVVSTVLPINITLDTQVSCICVSHSDGQLIRKIPIRRCADEAHPRYPEKHGG